jgi:hypothetical protein
MRAHAAVSADPVEPGGGDEGAPIDAGVAEIGALVAAAKAGDALAPVTVVVPSPYSALYVRRGLGTVRGASGHGVANVTCTTPDALIRAWGFPQLSATGLRLAPKAVVLEAVRGRAGAVGGWLGDVAAHERGLVALGRACDELRRCPVPTTAALSRRHGRIGELARLVQAVRVDLHTHGLADELDLSLAAADAANGARHAMSPLVCLDLGVLAPSQKVVLDRLAAHAGRLDVPDPVSARCTGVRPCADPAEEVREAVRAVVGRVDAGRALWRQAILHPAGSFYPRAVHQELSAAGVPSNGPERRRLDRSVAGTMFLGLLDLAATDWPRERVVSWMSSAPLVAGGGSPVPASRWDAVSARAGVVRGASQWSARLAHLAANDEQWAHDARPLAAFMTALVDSVEAVGPTWTAHARWAGEVLDTLIDPQTASWPEGEVVAAAQVKAAVVELSELDTLSGATDADTFRRTVRTVLEETAFDVSDLESSGFGDGVFVAPFGQARGVRFEDVAVLGLADAVVPGSVGEEPLIADHWRRLDISGGLRTRAVRIAELHGDLCAAVGAGVCTRTASYPRIDPRTGRAHVPSRWLSALAPPGTRERSVDSFAASVARARPPLSVHELGLHEMSRWVRAGGDPTCAPMALATPSLGVGIASARGRAGDAFTRFDGYVGPGRVSPFDPQAPLSATRLETYARCPRRFLFEKVLTVSALVPPEDLWRIEPVERGSLVHAVLEEYLLERLAGVPRSLERLLDISDRHLDEAEEGGRVGKALLWRLDRAAIRRDLRRFYEEEGDLVPLAAELPFGTDEDGVAPPVTVTLADGRQVRFKGKADRVDRRPSGQLVVSDYKTGKQSHLRALSKDPLAGGTLLQLPVYAAAADSVFGNEGPVHARYWLLSGTRSAPCYNLVVTAEVQARFRHVLGLIASAVEEGAFPGVPAGPPGDRQFDGCRFCDFDRVCPAARDRQWARKSGALEMAPVVELVDAPVPDEVAGAVVKGFVDFDGGPP